MGLGIDIDRDIDPPTSRLLNVATLNNRSREDPGTMNKADKSTNTSEKKEDVPSTSEVSQATRKKVVFKDLFWDQLITFATSAMIALTLLDILSSFRGDTVQCMTPGNYTRDQGAFVNNYCTQYTPPTDFFPFYLVAQATLIFGVHFLWYSWFSGKFRYFLSLAKSLDRHRESKTGDYSLRNFVVSRGLLHSFENSQMIFLLYLSKLLLQLVFSATAISFSFTDSLFGNFDAPFVCPGNSTEIPTTWPIGSYRIPCVLTSLVLLVAVRWLNVILLCGIVLAVLYGFIWCLWDHKSRLNWAMVARFSFDSGLPPSSYVPKKFILRYSNPRYICKYRMRNDFDFLFLKLFREDAGHAQVLREVLIDNYIGKDEQRQFEQLSLMKHADPHQIIELKKKSGKKKDTKKVREEVKDFTSGDRAEPTDTEGLGNTLQSVLFNIATARALGLEYLEAIDIAFGTTGYKLQLAARADRVVAVDLNHYFLNKEEYFHKFVYAADIHYFRTSVNIFSEEEATIKKFREQLARVYYDDEDPNIQSNCPDQPANVVVVGPIPKDDGLSGTTERGSRVVAVHWLLESIRQYKLLTPVFYIITVKPVVIEGHNVSDEFEDFEPPGMFSKPITTYRSSKVNRFKQSTGQHETPDAGEPRVEQSPAGEDDHLAIRCGWSNCDFKIQVYKVEIV